MYVILYFLTSLAFLLIDISAAPFEFRPIFIVALGACGAIVLKKRDFIFLFLLLSIMLYSLTALEQAVKLFLFALVTLFLYNTFHIKNFLTIILLSVFAGSFIFLIKEPLLFAGNFILTFALSLIIAKIFKAYDFKKKG